MLTTEQNTTLKAAILAETNATVVAARAVGNDTYLAEWYNANSTTKAWLNSCDARTLFEASDITKFNNLTAANRDAWRLMLDFAPYDFGKASNRKAIGDIWGTTDGVAVLQGCQEFASRAEVLFGGSSETTNTVTGLDRNWIGDLTAQDVGLAMLS